MNFKRLSEQAKRLINKRGGTDSLKEDAAELRDIARGKGSMSEKAKAAADAVKEPGARQEPAPAEPSPAEPAPAESPQDQPRPTQ
jgi:hypothetical protein